MEAIELVNIIYPEHDRTSCSDEELSNSFCFELDDWYEDSDKISEKYLPRCRRCALLQISRGKIKLTEENKEVIQNYF